MLVTCREVVVVHVLVSARGKCARARAGHAHAEPLAVVACAAKLLAQRLVQVGAAARDLVARAAVRLEVNGHLLAIAHACQAHGALVDGARALVYRAVEVGRVARRSDQQPRLALRLDHVLCYGVAKVDVVVGVVVAFVSGHVVGCCSCLELLENRLAHIKVERLHIRIA